MKNILFLLFLISGVQAQHTFKTPNESNTHSDYAVDKFGAKGDGITDDSKAIQLAINANCTSNGGMIELTPGKVYRAGGLIIPNFTEGYIPQFYIRGNGATIISVSDIILSKRVNDQRDAQMQVNSKVIIDGVRFVGNGKGTAVKIQATYGSEFLRCYFTNFEIGLDLQFCLAARIFQCHGQGNSINDFLIQSGTWKGATTSNSQCNASVFEQCRTYCKAGQKASIRVLASSGVVIRDCIIEGYNPVRGVDFDAQRSSTVKHFFIDNMHLECTPSDAGIFLNPWGGNCEIKSYWSQTPHVMIKSGHTSQGHIVIDNLQYIPKGASFSGDACMWYFKNLNWQVDGGGVKFSEFYKKHWSGTIPFYKSILLDNGNFDDGTGKYFNPVKENKTLIIVVLFLLIAAIFLPANRKYITRMYCRIKKKSNMLMQNFKITYSK